MGTYSVRWSQTSWWQQAGVKRWAGFNALNGEVVMCQAPEPRYCIPGKGATMELWDVLEKLPVESRALSKDAGFTGMWWISVHTQRGNEWMEQSGSWQGLGKLSIRLEFPCGPGWRPAPPGPPVLTFAPSRSQNEMELQKNKRSYSYFMKLKIQP